MGDHLQERIAHGALLEGVARTRHFIGLNHARKEHGLHSVLCLVRSDLARSHARALLESVAELAHAALGRIAAHRRPLAGLLLVALRASALLEERPAVARHALAALKAIAVLAKAPLSQAVRRPKALASVVAAEGSLLQHAGPVVGLQQGLHIVLRGHGIKGLRHRLRVDAWQVAPLHGGGLPLQRGRPRALRAVLLQLGRPRALPPDCQELRREQEGDGATESGASSHRGGEGGGGLADNGSLACASARAA
mmetsp:Transcript_75678/g.221876  ORF Transcript_75678/g.221876 Transcript_75678/m.221876 type:complete len:252 (-) Transcript_75678:7-762(-)